MKIPCLPLYVDEFVVGDSLARNEGGLGRTTTPHSKNIYLLSHFHTDHMKGLTRLWQGGPIVCSHVTRELVQQRFGHQVSSLVLSIPLWHRTALLKCDAHYSMCPGHSVTVNGTCLPQGDINGSRGGKRVRETNTKPKSWTVYVTLLPSFHIPGSVMFYLEAPLGNVLYTGDFKFHSLAKEFLSPFFALHPVDHIYLDDTWLHLGRTHAQLHFTPYLTDLNKQKHEQGVARSSLEAPSFDCFTSTSHPTAEMNEKTKRRRRNNNDGDVILTHLLNEEQLSEAFEAVRRRMMQQHRFFREQVRELESGGSALPYKIRVYLHNQFGKEMLVQHLAMRLGTRILLDDQRYARLKVVHQALEHEIRAPAAPPLTGTYQESLCTTVKTLEEYWLRRGGERAVYGVDLSYFTSSQLLKEEGNLRSSESSLGNGSVFAYPLIEVVNGKSDISPKQLQTLSQQLRVPHFAIVMSGWARLPRRSPFSASSSGPARWDAMDDKGSTNIWHVATTLHSTPQEIVDLVELLRPMSVTPFHYSSNRDVMVLLRLGPYMRTPYHNEYVKLHGATQEALSCGTWHFLLGEALDRFPRAAPVNVSTSPLPYGFRFHRRTVDDEVIEVEGSTTGSVCTPTSASQNLTQAKDERDLIFVRSCSRASKKGSQQRESLNVESDISSVWIDSQTTATSEADCVAEALRSVDATFSEVKSLFHFTPL